MYDVPGMNEGDSLADLASETDARFLRQHEVVADCSLKQLATVHAASHHSTPTLSLYTRVFII